MQRCNLQRRGYNIIASINKQGIIGVNNALIHDVKIDKEYFKRITTGDHLKDHLNIVVMGKNTWLSLPHKPLKNRINVVITTTLELAVSVAYTFPSFDAFLQNVKYIDHDEIYVIGGGKLYEEALKTPERVDKLFLTEFDTDMDITGVDPVYFPPFDHSMFYLCDDVKTCWCRFKVYRNHDFEPTGQSIREMFHIDTDEHQYLKELRDIRDNGDARKSRNSLTRSKFGVRMEFDLRDGVLPVLTTKKMAMRAVIKELLWFIRGDTNNKHLQAEGVHIWDGNDTNNGDLGPIYGFQWRHYGAEYKGCDKAYEGIDQLKGCIKMIKEDPYSRRMIVSAWNPTDIPLMALPPCHVLFQWFVSSNGGLSLQLYQRSGDFFLGVPFNIMSYSLLVHMVAHLTGLKADRMIHVIGDAHVYDEHLDAVAEQLDRVPCMFPTIEFKRSVGDIDDFCYEDIQIMGYISHPQIKAPMIA